MAHAPRRRFLIYRLKDHRTGALLPDVRAPWILRDRQRRNYLGTYVSHRRAVEAVDRILAAEAGREKVSA